MLTKTDIEEKVKEEFIKLICARRCTNSPCEKHLRCYDAISDQDDYYEAVKPYLRQELPEAKG